MSRRGYREHVSFELEYLRAKQHPGTNDVLVKDVDKYVCKRCGRIISAEDAKAQRHRMFDKRVRVLKFNRRKKL